MTTKYLSIATDPDNRDAMLKLLDETAQDVVNGKCIGVFLMPIHTEGVWATRSAGQIKMTELTGMLFAAALDAVGAMQDLKVRP